MDFFLTGIARNWRIPAICRLFLFGSPTTILGFIVSVIVYAIYGMAFWPWPHICQEIFEIILPPFAYLYTAASIILIGVMVFIAASIKHLIPRNIFWSSSQAVRGYGSYLSAIFSLKASTRLNGTKSNVGSIKYFLCSTVTSKFPHGPISLPTRMKFNGYKSIIALTGCDRWEFSSISHFNLHDRLNWLGPAGVTSTAFRAAQL